MTMTDDPNPTMPGADSVIQLKELLPDLDHLNADDRMVVSTLIRHSMPRLSLSKFLAHLESRPDQARDCVLRLIRKGLIRVLDVDDPRTMICVSLSPVSQAAAGNYRPDEPKWLPMVLVDDLPGEPPAYRDGSLSKN
jgi:hypothetical protein